MALSVQNQISIILANTKSRVSLSVNNELGVPTDPDGIVLTMMDTSGTVEFTCEWPVVEPETTRIAKSSTGRFYVELGSQDPNTETNAPLEWLLDWAVTLESGDEEVHTINKIKVVSATTISFLPEFRLMIDKTRKLIDPSNDCFLGYSDDQLITYLEGGVQQINAYQPYMVFTVDQFPLTHKQILLDAGLVVGVMSQQLFAIDSDIPNYNDQGTSFVISHQPQLASFLNQLTQRLDRMIPMMKMQFIDSGSVHVQMGPNFRLTQLVQASPSGSLFRNVWFSG